MNKICCLMLFPFCFGYRSISENDWNAQQYKVNTKIHYEIAMTIVNKLSFRGDETILDIGCGDGRTTNELAQRLPHGKVLGIDSSENMIEYARKSYATSTNLTFEQIAAEDIQFQEQFDLIVSFFVLHYISDHAKVLQNIKKALKPHGTFIALMALRQPEGTTTDKWSDIFAGQAKWNTKTVDEYQKLLADGGFTNIVAKEHVSSFIFATKEDIFHWIWECACYVADYENDKALQIAHDIVDRIACGKQENIEVRGPSLYVKAEKALIFPGSLNS